MEKVGLSILCIIILSMMVYPPTLYASKGGVASSSRLGDYERLEQLIDLAEKARIRAEISLQISLNLGFDTSMLQERYNLGLQLMDDATLEYNRGNYSEALNYILQAMKAFRECIRNATKIITEDKVNVSMGWMGLSVAVDRLERFIDRVKDTMHILEENYSVSVAEVESLLENIDDTLKDIKQLLSVGDISGAAKLLGEARAETAKALAVLRRLVCMEEVVARRMERYLDKFEEARSEVQGRIGELPPYLREKIKPRLDEVGSILNEVRGMVRNRTMNRVMERVMEMHGKFLRILDEMKG